MRSASPNTPYRHSPDCGRRFKRDAQSGLHIGLHMVQFDSNRPDFAPYGFSCVRWEPAPMSRPDRHNEIELNFIRSGWITYLLGGSKVRIEAGKLSAFWAAIPHQTLDYGEGTEYFVATIPLAWFLQCKLPDNCVQLLFNGVIVGENVVERASIDYEMFSVWERDLQQDAPGATKAVLLEVEARLIRLSLACRPLSPSEPSTHKRLSGVGGGALAKVEQMACLIAQHYTEHLSVDRIADAVKLHPNYAMGLFHRAFGTTLMEYLNQHRVSHAQRLLVTSDMKILDIALASGFGSLSRFNELFRRHCDCSPREYRVRHLLA